MFQITGTITDYKFDSAGFRKSVDSAIRIALRMAAREWLRAVIPHVPVYTGMARGSLQPLGNFLKVAIPISPVASRPGMGVAAGEALGSFEFSNIDGVYSFLYSTGVEHFITNNYYSVPLPLRNPTPWKAFEAGNAAFEAYLAENIPKRIPRVTPYIFAKTKTIR